MSGPNPPGPESEELEPGVEPSQSGGEFDGGDTGFGAGAGESDAEGQTGQTDVYSRAYSAPESEHISSGPYVPANLDLYDYDNYDDAAPHEAGSQHRPLAVDCRNRRDRRGDCPRSLGVAAVRPHRHDQGGDAQHRAHVDAADAGRDHRHDDAACVAAAVQRGAATAAAAVQRGAATAPAAGPSAARTGPSAGSGSGPARPRRPHRRPRRRPPGPSSTPIRSPAPRRRSTKSRSPTPMPRGCGGRCPTSTSRGRSRSHRSRRLTSVRSRRPACCA